MMKTYITPQIRVIKTRCGEFLLYSGKSVRSSLGDNDAINYGGVDNNGNLDPE